MPREEATKKEEELKLPDEQEDGFIPLPEQAEEQEEEEAQVEEGNQEEKQVESPKESPARFSLDEDEAGEEGKPEGEEEAEEPEFIELVHRGQVHRVTREKAIELAQKGFDYDVKVGPHGKIAKMIETDPELAKIVQTYWDGKISKTAQEQEKATIPTLEVKPMDQYESEVDWLRDNFQSLLGNISSMIQANSQSMIEKSKQGEKSPDVKAMLMTRDPANYNHVMSKFPEYVQELSIRDYNRIDTDPTALCRFFDYVRDQEAGKKKDRPNTGTISNTPKPSFRVRSGGGEAPRQEDDEKQAWKLSNEEFEKQLARVKGYL